MWEINSHSIDIVVVMVSKRPSGHANQMINSKYNESKKINIYE